jgi:hypothetical protein
MDCINSSLTSNSATHAFERGVPRQNQGNQPVQDSSDDDGPRGEYDSCDSGKLRNGGGTADEADPSRQQLDPSGALSSSPT